MMAEYIELRNLQSVFPKAYARQLNALPPVVLRAISDAHTFLFRQLASGLDVDKFHGSGQFDGTFYVEKDADGIFYFKWLHPGVNFTCKLYREAERLRVVSVNAISA